MDWLFRATIHSIIDGDTLVAQVDLGFHCCFLGVFRLLGIDTPELRGPERERGMLAKQFVQGRLPAGKKIVIRSTKQEKYGRYLADVWYSQNDLLDFPEIHSTGILLNQELIQEGHAK